MEGHSDLDPSEADSEVDSLRPLSLTDVVGRHWLPDREIPQDGGNDVALQNTSSTIFSVAMGMKRKTTPIKIPAQQRSVREHWREAANRALQMGDPWAPFHLELLPTEGALRYRYNALRKTWVTDHVNVKIAQEPFSHGAMRECFRMKKLSNFCHKQNWTSASNYVGKRYMEDVERDVYFEDVRLQMDAKLWSEEYNRHKPPKKVDIVQVCVLEFVERADKPLYHLEHFIEGNYVKYNSNSGFISCENMRLTPQAFSHFTFERSGHDLLVVDIQGVGDLYTDPQIHTSCGRGYGEGNLGTRGMSLFFRSHRCNHICRSLGLSPFDLCPAERTRSGSLNQQQQLCWQTQVRGTEELCISPSEAEKQTMMFGRGRLSFQSSDSGGEFGVPESPEEFSEEGDSMPDTPDSCFDFFHHRPVRKRYESESSFGNDEEDKIAFQEMVVNKARPSCIQNDYFVREADESDFGRSKSVLGQMHLDLCQFYEGGRFSQEEQEDRDEGTGEDAEERDLEFALFHLEQAAKCGNLEAVIALAKLYLQHPRHLLSKLHLAVTKENAEKGLDLMLEAASGGDRSAMVYVAKCFDKGKDLGTRECSWPEAICWYGRAVSMEDQSECSLEDARYSLLARQAQLYQEGGHGLSKDLQRAGELYTLAAEEATAAMKGRLANKFYMLAEEVWAQVTEE